MERSAACIRYNWLLPKEVSQAASSTLPTGDNLSGQTMVSPSQWHLLLYDRLGFAVTYLPLFKRRSTHRCARIPSSGRVCCRLHGTCPKIFLFEIALGHVQLATAGNDVYQMLLLLTFGLMRLSCPE